MKLLFMILLLITFSSAASADCCGEDCNMHTGASSSQSFDINAASPDEDCCKGICFCSFSTFAIEVTDIDTELMNNHQVLYSKSYTPLINPVKPRLNPPNCNNTF